jgi:hypothetical protein
MKLERPSDDGAKLVSLAFRDKVRLESSIAIAIENAAVVGKRKTASRLQFAPFLVG